MSSKSKRSPSLLQGVLVALVLSASSLALADTIDPSMPRTLMVGAPRGAAPSERLDGERSGRAKDPLPMPPVELWRRHLSGGIEQLPVVDAQKNIIVALTIPEVIALAPNGKEIWRVRTGPAAPLTPPVITSDGTIVVVSSAGQAWGISPHGRVRFTTKLGVRGRDIDAAPLALDDGGVVIAAGTTLVELDRDGEVRARATLENKNHASDGRITGALIAGPEGTLATTESGAVYSFQPPQKPRRLGSFGGFPRLGAALADARTLIAVVDRRQVVAFDLRTGMTHVRASAVPAIGGFFDGPVTVGKDGALSGLTLVATQGGMLLGIDVAGNEKVRVVLDKPPPMPMLGSGGGGGGGGIIGGVRGSGFGGSSGFFGPIELKPSPPLVLDPEGQIAFARIGGRVGVVGPRGNIALAGERVCSAPLGVVPAGNRRMLIACRDGSMWLFGE